MGIFDKLLKEGAEVLKEVASEENKEKASALFSDLKANLEEATKEVLSDENKEKAASFFNELKQSLSSQDADTKEPEIKEEYLTEDENDTRSCREKILEVLRTQFPQYAVKEDVSPTSIGGSGRFMDYSIVVYDGETPKLIMMIIGKTTTAHREYRWSRQEAEKRGYAFINFIEHYPNTPEYISDRLHRYL